MRFIYKIRAMYRRWNYKRKYGKDIDTAICEFGKYCIITEKEKKITLKKVK